MDALINKNALYKELIKRHGTTYTYLTVDGAIKGESESASPEQAKQIISCLKDMIKVVEKNVNKSITKQK